MVRAVTAIVDIGTDAEREAERDQPRTIPFKAFSPVKAGAPLDAANHRALFTPPRVFDDLRLQPAAGNAIMKPVACRNQSISSSQTPGLVPS